MAWIERVVAWHDLEVEYCEVTGQLLPRRYWSFEVDGRVLKAAHPRYERLYVEHVLPRRSHRPPQPRRRRAASPRK
jgi:hypothetical protein